MTAATLLNGTPSYVTGKAGQAITGAVVSGGFTQQGATWTVEAWVKLDSVPTSGRAAFIGWGASSWMGVNAAGNLAGHFGGTGQPLSLGVWHHVAIGLASGVAELWVDGTYLIEVQDSSTSVSAVTIGGTQVSGIAVWPGAVDEVRVSSGRRYVFYSNLTVPTPPFTVDSTTVALYHLDGNLTDAANAGSGTTTTTPTPTTTTTTPQYTPSVSVIAQPDQGWFQYSETHYRADGSGYVPLTVANLTNARNGHVTVNGLDFTARTLVFRYFFMEKFRDVDTLDPAFLTYVENDLAAIRQAGCKAVIRFAYIDRQDSNGDAPVARTLSHVDQLATVVNKYADIVTVLQAGFIGAWGEWYYTYNWGDSGYLTAQNLSDRNTLVRRLLDRFDSRIFVALRYLGSRQAFLGTANPDPGGTDSARLTHHNDAFLADDGNYGTYNTFTSLTIQQNRAYLSAMPPGPIGGESCRYNPPMTDWANASTELSTYRFGYLNPHYYGQTVGDWGQTNVDTAAKRFGHRLRVSAASIPKSASLQSTFSATVTLVNDGWNSIFRDRQCLLILDDGAGHTATYVDDVDLRAIGAGATKTISYTGPAPTTAGNYSAYLYLPDPSSAIASRADYAIQLANLNMFVAASGRNDLNSITAFSSDGTTTPPSTGGGTTTTPTTTPTPSPSGLRNIALLSINGVYTAVKLTAS